MCSMRNGGHKESLLGASLKKARRCFVCLALSLCPNPAHKQQSHRTPALLHVLVLLLLMLVLGGVLVLRFNSHAPLSSLPQPEAHQAFSKPPSFCELPPSHTTTSTTTTTAMTTIRFVATSVLSSDDGVRSASLPSSPPSPLPPSLRPSPSSHPPSLSLAPHHTLHSSPTKPNNSKTRKRTKSAWTRKRPHTGARYGSN